LYLMSPNSHHCVGYSLPEVNKRFSKVRKFQLKQEVTLITVFDWILASLSVWSWGRIYEDNCSEGQKWAPWRLVRKRTIPTERPPLVGEVSVSDWR
jgi:hypothetical protein